MSTPKPKDIGVIIARFQVDELHLGHKHLIEHVLKRHRHVLILLGVRHGGRTTRDPLTYEMREVMVRQAYPDPAITIAPIYDSPISHEEWSRDVDTVINELFPGQGAILYGSRKSFIPLYTGAFPAEEIIPVYNGSGTALREAITFPHTRDARAALIYEIQHRQE